jgi:hypothetical protein
MVKEYSGTFSFPYKWEMVCRGFWQKYPNPYSKHIITEDVISRHVTKDNILISKRLILKERQFNMPKWTERLGKFGRHIYVVEETHCDPVKKTLVSYTRNFSLTSMMTVIERCEYTKDPENPSNTICQKRAHIYSPLFGAGAVVESFAMNKFKKNAERASKGLIFILEKFRAMKGYC